MFRLSIKHKQSILQFLKLRCPSDYLFQVCIFHQFFSIINLYNFSLWFHKQQKPPLLPLTSFARITLQVSRCCFFIHYFQHTSFTTKREEFLPVAFPVLSSCVQTWPVKPCPLPQSIVKHSCSRKCSRTALFSEHTRRRSHACPSQHGTHSTPSTLV